MCIMIGTMDSFGRIPLANWTQVAFSEAQAILAAIAALDAKLGQANCVDPEKAKIMQRIEERLIAIESKLPKAPRRKRAQAKG